MKQVKIMVLSKRKIKINLLIVIASSVSIYLLISLYFCSHFFFNSELNGINVSLKAYRRLTSIISDYVRNYELLLIERSGETELIIGHDIGLRYNKSKSIANLRRLQNPFKWIGSLFKRKCYRIKDLYSYNKTLFDRRIDSLRCLNRKITEPQNVAFRYINGSYDTIEEVYGNKVNRNQLERMIKKHIMEGRRTLDLNNMSCYEIPKYTISSEKTLIAKSKLDKYVATKITYQFGHATEVLDGSTTNRWLRVDEDLEVEIDREQASEYIRTLAKKYDTVGITREFQSSIGKRIELQGGLYGWKIDRDAETDALIDNIKQGEVIEREPLYLQRAFSREGNEIGSTYVEINITRQQLWFYKDGKLLIQGPVVTGNPNRGHATVLGVYMINYKQKEATLRGPGYEAKVTYWMPFFGNMGLHDASWRSRFGGSIYLRNGTHGCVNAPFYLAQAVFENIDEGTPVILYQE